MGKALSYVVDSIPPLRCSAVNSFSADTTVVTKDGDTPIHEIEIGDYVLAWNEETGELSFEQVTDTIHHTDEVVIHLTIDGEEIETTPEHPFYVEGKGWVNAEDLEVGDDIRKADGSTGEVESIAIEETSQEMYNLTVDEAHTFFVGDGQWLVHNCPPASGGTNSFLRTYMYSDGTFHTIPSANTPLKLGYDTNLITYKNKIPGVDINNDALSGTGLVSLETSLKRVRYVNIDGNWKIEILEAMKNTNQINFIVEGMDIFNDIARFDPKIYKATHWEMDQVLRRGYVNKLQLWKGGDTLSPLLRQQWIEQWKLIRGLR